MLLFKEVLKKLSCILNNRDMYLHCIIPNMGERLRVLTMCIISYEEAPQPTTEASPYGNILFINTNFNMSTFILTKSERFASQVVVMVL